VIKKLDARLAAVAAQISSTTHADIGSDHARLLVALLETGRIEQAIAIENNRLPFENSVRALNGLAAEVRFGDGLNALERGEADSLSLCGLGAESIRDILLAHPDRIPKRVVIEVCQKPEVIRRWAFGSGYHLLADQTTQGTRSFSIMCFQRAEAPLENDPAYMDVDCDAAFTFGPFVLKREDRQFDIQLQNEEAWWRRFDRLSPEATDRLSLLRQVMQDRCVRALEVESDVPFSVRSPS
jgi:tRNA (adenine22-N1)-methyltransferase